MLFSRKTTSLKQNTQKRGNGTILSYILAMIVLGVVGYYNIYSRMMIGRVSSLSIKKSAPDVVEIGH